MPREVDQVSRVGKFSNQHPRSRVSLSERRSRSSPKLWEETKRYRGPRPRLDPSAQDKRRQAPVRAMRATWQAPAGARPCCGRTVTLVSLEVHARKHATARAISGACGGSHLCLRDLPSRIEPRQAGCQSDWQAGPGWRAGV